MNMIFLAVVPTAIYRSTLLPSLTGMMCSPLPRRIWRQPSPSSSTSRPLPRSSALRLALRWRAPKSTDNGMSSRPSAHKVLRHDTVTAATTIKR